MSDDTLTSTAENVDVSGTRPPLFDESVDGKDRWFTVTLDALLADWGEGQSKDEAIGDLACSLRRTHRDLHGESNEKLAEHLQYQRDFLCALLHFELPDVPA